jgi:hypothetical protein
MGAKIAYMTDAPGPFSLYYVVSKAKHTAAKITAQTQKM